MPISFPHGSDSHAASADAEAAGFDRVRLDRLRTLLTADVAAGVIPGAVVLISRAGQLACLETFGYADRVGARPMQHDSVFRIASMTKPMTVVAALMLMEQGKLLLTDPVSRYLPELRDVLVGVEGIEEDGGRRCLRLESPRRPMTVHDLMRHTAGFTYGQFGDSLVQRAYRAAHLIDNQQTNAELVMKLSQLPLAYQPGTTFEYGMSTDVLGRIVEVLSGMALDRCFTEYLTGPLDMKDTAFGFRHGEQDRLAEPQRDPAQSQPAVVPYDPARPANWFSGGGGLLSTAADYARFCQMLLNGGQLEGARLLGRKTVELMLTNHLPPGTVFGSRTPELGIAAPLPELGQGYGLGVGVRHAHAFSPVAGSSGDFYWGGSLGPYFWVDPQEKLIVVFMLQELNVQRRVRYRSLLRALVYQALI